MREKKEMKRLNEIAKVEKDQRLHFEMMRQRKEDGVKRRHLKGLIGDDATVSLHEALTSPRMTMEEVGNICRFLGRTRKKKL